MLNQEAIVLLSTPASIARLLMFNSCPTRPAHSLIDLLKCSQVANIFNLTDVSFYIGAYVIRQPLVGLYIVVIYGRVAPLEKGVF